MLEFDRRLGELRMMYVTLYGNVLSREELIEAAITKAWLDAFEEIQYCKKEGEPLPYSKSELLKEF